MPSLAGSEYLCNLLVAELGSDFVQFVFGDCVDLLFLVCFAVLGRCCGAFPEIRVIISLTCVIASNYLLEVKGESVFLPRPVPVDSSRSLRKNACTVLVVA